ncbi:methionyl-tRNA formyltransferase [Alkalibacillus haloalkaliphilus]|uniref:methionyl-tRNA formyltransferase n=1 Tax=Alkalibacillus haloalkaliphilus TaxID=94136 RepID=UPI002936B6FB|nr:methionyl-tRNA formyltransferase [Alkalibacillus haloalkaliphilus]MDV2583341.1 methionyl-tRNA formyltransferase [Alkalibacillus haloalkaliphilus]
MNYIIVANHDRYAKLSRNLSNRLDSNFYFISNKEDLTYSCLKEINPKYVFFPHWSYIIPEEIFNNFECIIFHMTDVPFGRGGSPLQNLVSRGIYDTKISALKCVKELDAGPVYLKRPLNLNGSAEEIYLRAANVIEEMIYDIITTHPSPIDQIGEVVNFQRRKPIESNIEELDNLEKVYDFIRMLDADGYPKAYVNTKHFTLEFERASFKGDLIHADVKIRKRDGLDE